MRRTVPVPGRTRLLGRVFSSVRQVRAVRPLLMVHIDYELIQPQDILRWMDEIQRVGVRVYGQESTC